MLTPLYEILQWVFISFIEGSPTVAYEACRICSPYFPSPSLTSSPILPFSFTLTSATLASSAFCKLPACSCLGVLTFVFLECSPLKCLFYYFSTVLKCLHWSAVLNGTTSINGSAPHKILIFLFAFYLSLTTLTSCCTVSPAKLGPSLSYSLL